MKSKFLALFLGFAAVLVAGEAALRIFGYVWRGKAGYEKSETPGYTILCLGDSYTFGSQEPPENSYPRQLERILNRGGRGRTFSVLNGGVPSYNTAQILRRLETDLDKANPDLVILLAGGANGWNYWGLDPVRLRGAGWQARLDVALDSIKLVKLAKLLRMGLKAGPVGPGEAYYDEAVSCILKGQEERAAGLFRKIVELEPGNGNNYVQLADLYSRAGRWDEALGWLQKGIKADPGFPGNYAGAAAALQKLGRSGEGAKYADVVFPAAPGRAGGPAPESGYGTAVRNWIGADIARIAAVCRERGVPLILQNYPYTRREFYTPEIYAAAAAENSLPLVDNYSAFREQLAKGRSLFGADTFGHPNAAGYGLMAAGAAAAIEKAGIFPREARPGTPF